MKVGLLQEGEVLPGITYAQRYHEMIREVALADKMGFHCWGTSEQHFSPPRFTVSAPEVLYAAVSQHTQNIKLRIMCSVLLKWNHPILVAERLATLDIVSNGRAEIGTARSNNLTTLETFGVDPTETAAQWADSMEVLAKALTSDTISHDGPVWKIPQRTIVPNFISKPHPAVSVAASSVKSHITAGERGIGAICFENYFGFDYLQDCIDGFRNAKGPGPTLLPKRNDTMGLYVATAFCAETRDEAVRVARDCALAYFRFILDLYVPLSKKGSYEYLDKMERLIANENNIDFLLTETPSVMIGTPDDFIKRLKKLEAMEDDAADEFAGVAIVGDRIQRLLRRHEITSATGPNTRLVDVGEGVIMPGFVDVHAHVEVACRISQSAIDCRAPECSTVADVQDKLSAACATTPAGEWVIGQANLFFDRKLKEGRLPTRAELDAVSTRHPVALRAGGHITVLNTKALAVSGIDRNFTPPTYSVTGLPQVERDASGEPTGIIKEMDTLLPFPKIEGDHLRRVLEEGIKDVFTRYGVTAIGEISETVEGLHHMESLAGSGRLASAIRPYLWAPGTMSLDEACNWRDEFTDAGSRNAFRIQGLKLFSDGGYSARSAAVNQPYLCSCGSKHPFRGDIALSEDYTREAFERTAKAGLQLAVHANGDRAQEWLCDVIITMGGAPGGSLRSRIEHAGNLMPDRRTSDKWAEAGIIPVPQPVFLYTFGGYFPDYLGDFGKRGRFPFASLLKQGWHLSGSSDVWIGSEREATNPLFSVWCCLKRQTYAGEILDAEETITVRQALRMHTIDAAAVMGEADLRGSLAPGKLADVIVLDRNPERVPIDDLRAIKVTQVYAAGRRVWSAGPQEKAS